MKNRLARRIGALLFAMAIALTGVISVTTLQGPEQVIGAEQTPGNATEQTPGSATKDPYRFEDFKVDNGLVWCGTKMDDGVHYYANIEFYGITSTAEFEKNMKQAFANEGFKKNAQGQSKYINYLDVYDTEYGVVIPKDYLKDVNSVYMTDKNYRQTMYVKVTNTKVDLTFDSYTKAENEKVSKLLTDAKVKDSTLQFTVAGTGALPGTTGLHIPYEGKCPLEYDRVDEINDGHHIYSADETKVYYYNESKNVLEYVLKGSYMSWDDYSGNYHVNLRGINKTGTYVISKAELPAELTTGKVNVANTASAEKTEEVTTAMTATITAAKKDETVKAEIPAKTEVAKDVLEAAKTAGVKLVLESNADSYVSWSFDAITSAEKNFDPTVTVDASVKEVSEKLATVTLPATTAYTQVSFAYDGDLPGKAEVTLDLSTSGKFTEGKPVYLYYFNPTYKFFEETATATYVNGFATFTMTHCSDYIVSAEKLPESLTKVPDAPSTGGSYLAVYGMVMLFCLAVVAIAYAGKKKEA